MGLVVDSLAVEFGGVNGTVCALDSVSFAVRDGELVTVVGPSGCGKTTLLRCIAGLVKPSGGEVALTGGPAGARVRCALVFQEHGLLPWCTVLANVTLGLDLAGVPRAEGEARALAFIEQVGLEKFVAAYPHELSVGMRQRVALARAFVTDAEVLLLDEPFAALDAQTRLVLQVEMLRIWRRHRKTVVHVTHDIEEAILLGDRVLVMSGRPGRILEDITVPLGRPRVLRAIDRRDVAELKWRVWDTLEQEVRGSLGLEVER